MNPAAQTEAAPAGPAIEKVDQALIHALDAYTWAGLDIPAETRFLGDMLTSSSRVFVIGGTGLGKTQLGHAMAAGIASGRGFLHWRSDRPARCLVVDGEMSKALLKERIGSALRRGEGVPTGHLIVYALDRADEFAKTFPGLGNFEPLNTVAGQEFVLRLIASVQPDVIVFDNVMSLISGDQKDEVPWSETLPLVAKITAQGIAQIWLDHTGHDRSRQYGSATKAWRFDAVGIMTAAEDQDDREIAFQLSFDAPGKARRRSPDNWADFAPHVIRLAGDEWTSEPVGKRRSGSALRVEPAAAKWHEALLNALCISATPGSVPDTLLIAEGIRMGLTEAVEPGDTRTVRERKMSKFRTAKAKLVAANWIGVNGAEVCNLVAGRRPDPPPGPPHSIH